MSKSKSIIAVKILLTFIKKSYIINLVRTVKRRVSVFAIQRENVRCEFFGKSVTATLESLCESTAYFCVKEIQSDVQTYTYIYNNEKCT